MVSLTNKTTVTFPFFLAPLEQGSQLLLLSLQPPLLLYLLYAVL
jgi:hypothetical protein